MVERLVAQGGRTEEDEHHWRAEQLARVQPRLAEVEAVWVGLTTRERQVLQLLAQGRNNKQIARFLAISEKTVETHMGNLLGKLGAASRTEAAVWAVRTGVAAAGKGPSGGNSSEKMVDFPDDKPLKIW